VAVTADTSGGNLSPYVSDGIRFIINCARRIAMSRPVQGIVINFSYGVFAGPHDGTAALEQDIEDRITEARGLGLELRVVLPAGNSFLARTHAHFTLRPGDVASLPWRVVPDDQTPSYVEIWLPGAAPATAAGSRLTLRVRSPGGTAYTITEQGGTVLF